jgi:hypothetical protein
MRRKMKHLSPDAPLLHPDHPRPVTRRDFIRQGFVKGAAAVTVPSLFGLLSHQRQALADLSPDIEAMKAPQECDLSTLGAGKIPFICFDLAGGANIAGSNVLVGTASQLDYLNTGGYNRLGLPGDMLPQLINAATNTEYTDLDLGLAFHSESAMLRGIKEKFSIGNWANTNGSVIPARSENDTANNPHNPMYAISRCGAGGQLLDLIGSRSSDSGGNSVAPADLIDPTVRPTKIDRPSDVSGLVDTGKLVGLLSNSDAVAVMESIYRITNLKTETVTPQTLDSDEAIKKLIRCGYVKSADLVDEYGDPSSLDVLLDTDIVSDAGGIFTQAEFDSDSEFRKAASVMKLVINGYAGAGTITMGGYDYHTGDRSTGELRDLRAGRCMGACLEYAARRNQPLMLYVFSDGSVSSNGTVDNSADGGGKGVWTGDNQSTAASFFLVYNPGSRPALINGDILRQQIGSFNVDGSVNNASSPAANNVNLLVQTVALNYLALHGEQGNFTNLFGTSLGNSAMLDSLTVFEPIV